MKMNPLKVVKVLSILASVAGMVGSAWVSDREAKLTLENLVNSKLNNK